MKRLMSVVAVACVLGWAGAASGQSLGELAKKNADAKAKKADDGRTKPPVKTYTDADLKDVPPVKPTVSVPAPAAGTAVPAPDSAAVYQGEQIARGEGYWKDRMRTLEGQATADGLALEAATTRLRQYEAAVQRSRVDVNGVPLVSREYQRRTLDARDEVSRLLAAVRTDSVAVDNLQEEARRANVPPGWLRTR